ncbi:hypothetical protein AAU61_01025 [Desulfocarbo indianensis]|nr:hypothetical protein AAU61_01025 [Desulfocarbo indianensis]
MWLSQQKTTYLEHLLFMLITIQTPEHEIQKLGMHHQIVFQHDNSTALLAMSCGFAYYAGCATYVFFTFHQVAAQAFAPSFGH